jgi:hypothetical protein
VKEKTGRSNAVTDEIRKDNVSDPEELTTADLAGVGEKEQRIRLQSRMDAAKVAAESRVPEPPTGPEPRDRTVPMTRGTTAPLAAETPAGTATATARAKTEEELSPLFSADEANNLHAKWDSVQVAFVDEPRQAVEEADRLIAATMKRLAEIFAEERQKLEQQWDKGDNVSTEDLRIALRRYRSFFTRLLRI